MARTLREHLIHFSEWHCADCAAGGGARETLVNGARIALEAAIVAAEDGVVTVEQLRGLLAQVDHAR